MDIYQRLKEVRKQRGLRQEDVAQWYGLSGASYGRKEKGREGGFGPSELQLFIERTHVDARYLFGQIESFERADLLKHPLAEDDDQRQLAEIKELIANKIPDVERKDAEYEALNKREIREIVRLLKPYPSDKISRVLGYVEAKTEEWDADRKGGASVRAG